MSEGKDHFDAANLRIEIANLKRKLRTAEVEKEQADEAIMTTLSDTKCPSLSVLILWFKHYQENYPKLKATLEKLVPHLEKLPTELALEIKAALGRSPDTGEETPQTEP